MSSIVILFLHSSLALQMWPALALPASPAPASTLGSRGLGSGRPNLRRGGVSLSAQSGDDGDLFAWRKREVGNILRFSLPALSIPLADPIMSLVDSVCVGQYASTLELAALGPNLVIFNFVTFSFSFLAIGTTLRVSAALADDDTQKASNTISTALLISLVGGAALLAFMLAFSQPTLAATGAVPELLAAAGGYLLVRIWACPAVLATTVLQSGLLAQRDSFTCLLAVLISAAFNVVGDIVFITKLNMGLVGAAWATMLGNYLSLLVLVLLGYTSWGESLRDSWERGSGGGGGTQQGGEGFSTRRAGAKGLRLQWHVPTGKEMASFGEALGPLFFISVCKNLCYLMLQSVATTFSTVTCAAHQAMWSVWAICSFCPTPLEQCAQVMLPRHVREDTARAIKAAATPNARRGAPATIPGGFTASREFVKCLAAVAGGTGCLLGLVIAASAKNPQLLTADGALYGIMASFIPYMMASLLMAPITIFLDGVLQVRMPEEPYDSQYPYKRVVR